MTLTSTQLTRMRNSLGDTGDTGDTLVFTNYELNDLYDQAIADARTGEGGFNRAVWYGFEALAASASKLTDYAQNATDEKRSQIFAQVNKMMTYWKSKVDDEIALGKTQSQVRQSQVRIVGLEHRPPRQREEPLTPSVDASQSRTHLW